MTFAGSPDRVESRLVPEAGFELDTFAVSGIPRRLGVGLVRSRLAGDPRAVRVQQDPVAAPAGRRARRGWIRRGADGARRPATRHPGGADRGGRAPRAREPARRAVRPSRLPRLRDRRAATDRSIGSSVGRSRPRTWAHRRRRAARCSGCRRTGPCSRCSVGLREPRRSTSSRSAPSVSAAPRSCTSPASATTTRCGRACTARTTCSSPRRTTSARRSLPPSSRSRERVGPSGSSPPRERRRSSCRIRTRPPTIRRSTPATSPTAAERSSSISPTSRACPPWSAELLGDPARLARMSDAMKALARPDARRRRRRRAPGARRSRAMSAPAARGSAPLLRRDRRGRAVRLRELRARVGR